MLPLLELECPSYPSKPQAELGENQLKNKGSNLKSSDIRLDR